MLKMLQMSYFDEWLTPEYQNMVEYALREKTSAFGRWAGRPKHVFTFNEWIVYSWLLNHGVQATHNYTIRDNNGHRIEIDLYVPGYAIMIDPAFHTKLGHKATREVYERDRRNDEALRAMGLHIIRIVVYNKMQDFLDEVERKLMPLVR